jgi:hypothetical protein
MNFRRAFSEKGWELGSYLELKLEVDLREVATVKSADV